jgi:uncharacterized protein YijF (DUF1287 family)
VKVSVLNAPSLSRMRNKGFRQLVALALAVLGTAALAQTRGDFLAKLSSAAMERTHHSVRYVSDYVHIAYPGGDVPANTGVCTDEVIRSYRALGIDLQRETHEDMLRDFDAYPHGRQRRPDANIDHRRVPNLMVFFPATEQHCRLRPIRMLTRLATLSRGAWAEALLTSASL